jgi:hypothetical protein
MSSRPLVFASLFLVALMAPMSGHLIGTAQAEGTVVCCDSVDVGLHLLGSDSSGTMSPFMQDLSDSTRTKTITTAVASEETVGTWSLPDVWPGTVPASTWTLRVVYEVADAAGAQINATASLQIGSQTYTATTPPGNSFLPQGTGTLDFDIEVDQTTVSSSSNVVLTLTARTVVFNLPTGDARLEFQWGSEESDSILEGEMPLVSLTLLEPEVEGSEVYFSVVIDSYWGTKILSNSESLNMRVNGVLVSGDPIETSQGDGVRITWTWLEATGGEETVEAKVELMLQPGDPTVTGMASFLIETFDSNGGTGTYYPPDEPLRTNGDGSPLTIAGTFELEPDNGQIRLIRETTITIEGEMAFWMRWGLDHIGDDVTDLSPVLRNFNAGSVTDEDRISRSIEPIEKNEFESQMQSESTSSNGLTTNYLTDGLGLDVDHLLGDIGEYTLEMDLDLHGENDVVNHPVSLIFRTSQLVPSNTKMVFLQDFIIVQPAPLWSEFSMDFEGTSSGFSAFIDAKVLQSDSVKVSHSRLPWGETISISASNLEQDEEFTLSFIPTATPLYAPVPMMVGLGATLLAGFFIALMMTKTKSRRILMLELILVPLVALIHYFAFMSVFVASAVVCIIVLWWVTAITSPRIRLGDEALALVNTPSIPCPACATNNAVLSDERPLRFACAGCARVIKLVA